MLSRNVFNILLFNYVNSINIFAFSKGFSHFIGCAQNPKKIYQNSEEVIRSVNRLGSRFRVNETYQISDRYSVQIKAAMKQKRLVMLVQMYLSIIEFPNWHSAFGDKRLCYCRNFHLEPTLYKNCTYAMYEEKQRVLP